MLPTKKRKCNKQINKPKQQRKKNQLKNLFTQQSNTNDYKGKQNTK
jgi:hypothetical protein